MTEYLLGVDGGGTKTIACLAEVNGKFIAAAKGVGTNFQSCGKKFAATELRRLCDEVLKKAGATNDMVRAACYGLCGADRKADFETVHGFLKAVTPTDNYELVNDTEIALRAGTPAGIGIGLIGGTGVNCIGRGADGRRDRVGGQGKISGDYGAADDLIEDALFAASRAFDGRGPQTVLLPRILELLNLSDIRDIATFFYIDSYNPAVLQQIAPLVYEVACEGDDVATALLEKTGLHHAQSSNVLLERLFKPGDRVHIVLGGSQFQRATCPIMIDTLKEKLDQRFEVELIKLEHDPVLGALYAASDLYHGGIKSEVIGRLTNSYRSPSED
jgi:N-acetylglucosamine kinase-like BadF-type ATPase